MCNFVNRDENIDTQYEIDKNEMVKCEKRWLEICIALLANTHLHS